VSDLINVLQKKGSEFNFFQAMALLEEYFGGADTNHDSSATNKIKFTANPEICFPAGDISSIKKSNAEKIEFQLSFMGLIGVSSPLPNYFIEYGAEHSFEKAALTDFLNIFDNRIYNLFYLAWKKYRAVPSWRECGDYYLFNCASSIAGFDALDLAPEDAMLLSYTGLFAGGPRNAEGLAEIIAGCLGGVKVFIEQWAPRWMKVNEIRKIGVNLCLSENSTLGERIFDRSGKFNVVLELCESDPLENFIPGSYAISQVKKIVKVFLPQPLAYEIQVKFAPASLIPVVLGVKSAGLGIGTACGNSKDKNGWYVISIPGV
jgi:type VI secretion system protein ImpH